MSENDYRLETKEQTFVTRTIGIEIGDGAERIATFMQGEPGDPRVSMNFTAFGLNRERWALFKRAVDEAFDLFDKRWPK